MSRISQDFINDLGFLYEHIHVKDQDFLNEESEYYDEEASELVEDIISTVSLSMIYEGFSANAVIGFLADSSEEEIIEKYLSFDENILTESNVSEEYIEEQLEILNEFVGALFRVGKALVKGAKYAKGAKGAAPFTRMASGFKSAGTAAERIAKQGPKASSIVRSTLSKGVQKVKDIAKGAKAALTGPTAKKVALGAAGLGAAGLAGGIGGYMGAKLAGAGSGSKPTDSPRPTTTTPAPAPAAAAPKPVATTPAPATPAKPATTPAKPATTPAKPATTPAKPDYETWAKKYPDLASRVKPGQSGYEEISARRDKPGSYEKQDQTPTQGSPTAQIDPRAIEDSLKAEQERQKKRMEQQNKTPVTAKESYEPYDIVLNYLLSEGHADTLDEANYIMLEMDENAICTIVEEYNNYLLAEEIEEWVNDFVNKGYDFSEYTWDDVVEYYVNEKRQLI
jgi:hypothetical protein